MAWSCNAHVMVVVAEWKLRAEINTYDLSGVMKGTTRSPGDEYTRTDKPSAGVERTPSCGKTEQAPKGTGPSPSLPLTR